MTHSQQSRRAILHQLCIAGLFVGFSALISFLAPDHFNPELGQRLLGVVMGAFVAFYGNASSKTLRPIAQMRCDPIAEQAARRFSAWSLTLGGLSYSLAWLIAPLSAANVLAVALLGSAVLLVVVRCAWAKTRGFHS